MEKVKLEYRENNTKIGDSCGPIAPNVIEDSLFVLDGEAIGFYIKNISVYSALLEKLLRVANKEFLSSNVKKSNMRRSSGLMNRDNEVVQYSTILGAVPPKANMRRLYPSMSSVHQDKKSELFIKAMILICKESEKIIKKVIPNVYSKQKEIIEKNVPKKWRFGKLFRVAYQITIYLPLSIETQETSKIL